MRPRRPLLVLLIGGVLIAAGAASGCADNGQVAATDGGRIELTLDDGAGGITRTSVACADAPALCAELRRVRAEPPDRVCTQIYGGPERIVVRGTLDGAPLDLTVTRTDGCEIDRYDRISAAIPGGG